ncbi:MAG: hypothetical protein L3J28_02525 [Candidatus Polarisedimenticolaceae bacterium]|nr:hypothetical protein [Candidatus Polarisedimenticolaceae bacterium]
MNSHIIPEFIYKSLYDEKHRFHVISTYKQKDREKEQKGIRERLLCIDCEQHISRYENYARKVLFGGVEITVLNEDGGIVVSDIDYKLFKLFQLSILWRASISNHKMFKDVSLGPHELTIRKMLMSNKPGTAIEYCCVMMAIKAGEDTMSSFIDQPEKKRINGYVVYRFIFGSIAWLYFVASHNVPKIIRGFVLSETGTVRMAIKDIKDMDCIAGFAREAQNMGRFPDEIA